MSDRLLTIQEAAERLRISERTAYELARAGELAGAIKVGGSWRVDLGKLNDWIRMHSTELPKNPKRRKK